MPISNRGKFRIMRALARNDAWPASFYVALVADTPTPNTKTFSELTEIATGNGYTGPIQITRDGTGFPAVTESDADNLAYAQLRDIAIQASGGPIPSSGQPITNAVFTDDNATPADREVWGYSAITQSVLASGDTLDIDDWRLMLLEGILNVTGIEDVQNVGTSGVGLFKQIIAKTAQFYKLNAGSNLVSVALDVANNEVDVDVNEANLALDASQIVSGELFLAQGGTGEDFSGIAAGDLIRGAAGGGAAELLNAGSDLDVLTLVTGLPEWVTPVVPAVAEIATGSYTGNGGATQAITGLGFQPDAVYVYSRVNNQWVAWKSDQDGVNALISNDAGFSYQADHVVSLDADGFTVGDGTGTSNVMNVSARPYAFVAWKA